MARKYELITELYRSTQKSVTAPANWQRFLTSASMNFRLSFDEQLLVYAQRPDATAVLEIERWNHSFGRWVNRGATGIAVFDDSAPGRSRLKHYFDISDTHATRFARPVPIWTVREEYAPDITETLENSFGELEDKTSLAAALVSAAKNAVQDNMPDYLTELRRCTEDSFLEELDELNVEVAFRTALQNSVAFMLLARCGCDPGEYFNDDDFRGILDFNTPQTLNALGTATGDIAQMCLGEISRTVLNLQRLSERENRTFAAAPQNEYPISRNETTHPERSFENDRDHIPHGEQLPAAEPAASAGAGGTPWEIRIASPEVPEAEPPRDLHEPADVGQAERAPDGDRTDGAGPDGAIHGADGEGSRRDGGTESRGSDEVGGPDEQYPALGGGNGAERPDLQLNGAENAESEELPAFLDEKLIMAIVSNPDDDLKYKKHQIELYFSVHPDEDERAEYLKSAYQDRYTELIVDGQRVGYKAQENGLLMWDGAYLSRTKESVFSWTLIAEWVGALIEKKEYFINTDFKPLKDPESQQLTLFDFADFGGSAPQDEGQMTFLPRPQLPQQVIDEALCIGSNEEQSRLIICAWFMKDKPLEENARFLMAHYGENGAGFYLNDRPYSVWYNAEGLRVSSGESVQRSATVLSWEDAARRIRELLEIGRYMPQSEIDRAPEYEKARLADDLLYMYRDIDGDNKDAYFLSMKPAYELHGGFPGMSAAVKELLEQPDTLQALVDECRAFIDAYEQNPSILRFRYRPKELLQRLTDLQREPLTFTAAEGYDPQRRFFISGDELDQVLRGSTEYRLAVYSFYRNNPDRKEREKFLKDYHGEYSGYHGGNDNRTYTSKGLSFSHGSLTRPYAKIELSWQKIARRVSALIASGKFISEEDRAAMPTYEKHQLARQIQAFFDGVPRDQPKPYPYGVYFTDAIKVIEPQLDDPAKVEEIYQMMIPVWESTNQDDRSYPWRKRGFENLSAFRDGTFSLFGEVKQPKPVQVQIPGDDVFQRLKQQYPNHLVFIRNGDYYEAQGDDAVEIQRYFGYSFTTHQVDEQGVDHVIIGPSADMLDDCLNAINALGKDAVVYHSNGNISIHPAINEPVRSDADPELEQARELINAYCMEEFDQEADFSDLSHVDLAFSATSDSEHTVEVYADLTLFQIVCRVDEETVREIACDSLPELNEYLANLEFDRMVADAEEAFTAMQQETAEPEQPAEEEQPAALAPPKPRRERVVFSALHPEIPADQRSNFRIIDPNLGVGTPSEKYAANVAAIRLLKRIEDEDRLATPEEQEVLSRYVGWGGLADCFDDRNAHYEELKSLLSEDEYAAARASSLTAFYTSPVIVEAMYQALGQMGFQTGNILEPSCGVGNFIGMLPEAMAGSKIYGVELDSISGRIARQLYQNSSIAVNGFEKVQMPDSFFDVAIGNVPFGDFKVLDKRYDKNHWLIHDYFFGKTLDKVRPGGIVAFITSKGTMDKENSAVRKYLAQRADLIGAIRLPDNAFKRNAGTEVTSDILFLQKRDRMTDIEPDWVHLDTDENDIRMNRYFVQHPDMVLGNMVMESTRFGMDSACKAYEGADLSEQLAEAIQNLHAEITAYEVDELDEEEDRSIPADPEVRNFSYTIVDGKIYFRENSRMQPVEASVTAENRIRGMIALRDCTRRLIELQTEGYPNEDILKEQGRLNTLYDEFTKKYGLISSRGNSLAFSEDSSYCLLCSLEVLDEEGNFKCKADMFTKRTIRPHEAVTSVDTASEALAVSIAEKARVDLGYMASLMGGSEHIPQIVEALKGVIFKDPHTGPFDLEAGGESWALGWQTADEYLSGNVRVKLREAQRAAEDDPFFAGNVTALEAVQPVDLTAGEIGVRIGANWVPIEV